MTDQVSTAKQARRKAETAQKQAVKAQERADRMETRVLQAAEEIKASRQPPPPAEPVFAAGTVTEVGPVVAPNGAFPTPGGNIDWTKSQTVALPANPIVEHPEPPPVEAPPPEQAVDEAVLLPAHRPSVRQSFVDGAVQAQGNRARGGYVNLPANKKG